MVFSGLSPDGRLVEISELSDHPYMVGSQFHPEFKSRPTRPHPLFLGLLKAAQHYNEEHHPDPGCSYQFSRGIARHNLVVKRDSG